MAETYLCSQCLHNNRIRDPEDRSRCRMVEPSRTDAERRAACQGTFFHQVDWSYGRVKNAAGGYDKAAG